MYRGRVVPQVSVAVLPSHCRVLCIFSTEHAYKISIFLLEQVSVAVLLDNFITASARMELERKQSETEVMSCLFVRLYTRTLKEIRAMLKNRDSYYIPEYRK